MTTERSVVPGSRWRRPFPPGCLARRGAVLGAALFLAWAGLGCGPGPGPGSPAALPTLLPEPDAAGGSWVEETLSSLTLREAIGQLIIPWMSGAYASLSGPEFQEFAGYVEEYGIGGIVISIGLPHSYAAKLNALQARAPIPLLVASDFENGGPGMRINHSYALPTLLPQGGGTSFPPTMAFGAIGEAGFAREYGRITAQEARAVGVHLNFAPVLDVNSNPLNPIINTRSFGEDPEAVATLGAAYLAGAREGGALTTAKHFPGHGDTKTDSHVELPIVDADRARLDRMELVPFRRAVEEGVDAVMTAHVAVPGILGPEGPPATLSPFFLTQLLREEMGFRGLLLTDALRMRAISDGYGVGEAAVLAVQAGADVILAPADIGETVDALEDAVRSGRISRDRLNASVRRILQMKARVGLHRSRMVNLDRVAEVVGSAEHLAQADSAASRSITLPRDREGLLPLDPWRYPRVLHVVYARGEDLVAGRTLQAALGTYFANLTTVRITPESPEAAYHELGWARGGSELVIVSVFVPPRAGAGEVAVPEALSRFVQESAEGKPTVVVSLGNPYLLSSFPEVGTYLLAWGPHEVSQAAAARALVGESAVSGRLPISLPPFHALGDGLDRAAVPAVPRLGLASSQELEVGLFRREEGAGAGPAGRAGEDAPVSALEVDPASVGMDPRIVELLDSLILTAIADSASPGVALAVGRHGKLVRLRGYGRLDWAQDAPLATPSSLWDMASVTKVAATTTAVMILVEAGRLKLDAPVVSYLPWWSAGDPRKETVTVRQLLLHRGGLPPFRTFFRDMEGEEAYRRAIADLPLDYAPGDSTVYSDIGFMTLAFIVQEITGTPVDRFLRERVWDPLGMQDTGFKPDSALLPRVAATEVDTTYRFIQVRGVVHDENAFAIGGVAGHAGLFSSAQDMAVLAQTFLDGGIAAPCTGASGTGTPCSTLRASSTRILAPTTVELFTRRYDATASRALGWDTPTEGGASGDFFTDHAFGHTGFTGTSVWIDPALDLFVVLLTSRTNPTRSNTRHVPLRRAVHDTAARAITDQRVTRRSW